MITFKEFMQLPENLWGEIPGNPALRGKKPSDGRGGYSLSSNQPGGAQGAAPKFMKKKMRKK